jgi:class 3 adenylate cyclase
MLRSHWGIASRTITDMVSPGVPGDTLDRMAAHTRASVTGEMAAALLEMSYACDVTAELARITAPTVIIHRDHDRAVAFRLGRALAAHIAGARLVTLEGQVHWPWAGDMHSVTNAIVEFLNPERGAHAAASSATASQASGTAVILFTDIVSSTELTERMGDSRFRDASRALDAGLRAAIRVAGGAAIEGKLLGDGVLATFPSAAQAIDGARRCLALSAASELGLHIGLHAGDVIREEGNVFGGAVNIASRICGLSAPGEILVSDVVRGMARSSAGVEFEDRGEQEMKGVGEPVRVYAVRKDGG